MNAAPFVSPVPGVRLACPPPGRLAVRAANDNLAPPGAAPMPRALPITMPLSAFRGIAARVRQGTDAPVYELTLLHDDPARSVPLTTGREAGAIAREWKAWGEALRLPLLAIGDDGGVEGELRPYGALTVEAPAPRRKGSALVGRRTRFARRRAAGTLPVSRPTAMRQAEDCLANP